MKVLVTGANGHCGANTVRSLLARGHEPVCMIRESSNRDGLDGLDVELRFGDILDADAVHAAAKGVEGIVNLAAVYKLRGKTEEEIMEPAVRGVENVLRAAAKHGVPRVVHTSSAVAIGSGSVARERGPDDWNDTSIMPYHRAKTLSERRARELAAELGVDVVTINPVGVVGRHAYSITPTQKFVFDFARGRSITAQGGFGLVDVRDVAEAHASALMRAKPGGRYPISGANTSIREIADTVSAITGRRVLHMPAPRAVALPFVWAAEKLSVLVGHEPLLTYNEVYEMAHRYLWVDSRSTSEDLELPLRGLDELLRDTLLWMVDRGELRDEVAERVKERFGEPGPWD